MKKNSLFKTSSFAEIYGKFGVVLILIVAVIVGFILTPKFLVAANLLSVAKNVAVYGIMALGMTMLLIGGGVDLSAGSSVAFCAVVIAVIYHNTGSTTLGIILALVSGTVIGMINGLTASYIGLPPFIATLATQMTIRGIAYLVAGGAPVYGVGAPVVFLGQGDFAGLPMLLLLLVLATLITLFVLNRTSYGRYLYAIGGNQEAARASGINVEWYRWMNYTVMGFLCGFAGILYAGRTNSGLPAGATNFEFEAIIGAVLGGTSMAGGVGNVICSIVGIYVVGIINNVMNLCSVNAFWQQVVKGIVILVAVLIDVFTRNAIMKSTKRS
jgi:ribose/xylose/arabinose/galactoside ABC-type transport system permease subunit